MSERGIDYAETERALDALAKKVTSSRNTLKTLETVAKAPIPSTGQLAPGPLTTDGGVNIRWHAANMRGSADKQVAKVVALKMQAKRIYDEYSRVSGTLTNLMQRADRTPEDEEEVTELIRVRRGLVDRMGLLRSAVEGKDSPNITRLFGDTRWHDVDTKKGVPAAEPAPQRLKAAPDWVPGVKQLP
jgi:hypothetical protein